MYEENVLARASKLGGLCTKISKQSMIILTFAPKFSRKHIGVIFSNTSQKGHCIRNESHWYMTSKILEKILEAVGQEILNL